MALDYPHRRFNQLACEWVLVSPHRAKRPWLGQVEKTPAENLPAYDPTCYLCPATPAQAGCRIRGADTFVAGSAIFGAKDYRETIVAMRAALATL